MRAHSLHVLSKLEAAAAARAAAAGETTLSALVFKLKIKLCTEKRS